MNIAQKRICINAIKIAVTTVLVAIILYKTNVNKIIEAASSYLHIYAAVAVAFAPIIVLLGTYKWKKMLEGIGTVLPLRVAGVSFMGGMGIGLLTPMRVGELSRIVFLPGDKKKMMGAALVDKAVDLEGLLLIASLGSIAAFGFGPFFMFCGASVFGLVFLLKPSMYMGVVGRLSNYLPFRENIGKCAAAIQSIPSYLILYCLMIRLGVCLVDMVQFLLLLSVLHPVGIKAIIATYPLVILINTFPITISGLGLREGAAAVLLALFGVPAFVSVTASFLLFIVNTLLPGVIGILLITPRLRLMHKLLQ
jgi:uncharacterized membrane protein YbhN (UPF0104 family)